MALAGVQPLADPLDDLVAGDRWRRAQGLRRYERAHGRDGDAAAMLPMLLFEEVTRELPPGHAYLRPSWASWRTLPAALRTSKARDERAAWIRARVTPDDLARLPAALRDVERLGARAVAERLAAPIAPAIELTAAERARLEADERAVLA